MLRRIELRKQLARKPTGQPAKATTPFLNATEENANAAGRD